MPTYKNKKGHVKHAAYTKKGKAYAKKMNKKANKPSLGKKASRRRAKR